MFSQSTASKSGWARALYMLILAVVLSSCVTQASVPAASAPSASEEFVVGVILVGPDDDHGWSQTHATAAREAESAVPGVKLLMVEALPIPDVARTVDDFVLAGAKLIFVTSSAYQDETLLAAQKYPEVMFVHMSGQTAFDGKNPANLAGYLPRFHDVKSVEGCAAALTTQSGMIGTVGPMASEETLLSENAVYLGAKYCWENLRGMDPAQLVYKTVWIGFWFETDTTLKPVQVAHGFVDEGIDVLISGIDTTEALVVASQRKTTPDGNPVWGMVQDYDKACAQAPDFCLGIPYYNFTPTYVDFIQRVENNTWEAKHWWPAPLWTDIDSADSPAAWLNGPALSEEAAAQLEIFIKGMGDGSINLWQGPLYYQDGSVFIVEGETVTDEKLWHTQQLLEGMVGTSK